MSPEENEEFECPICSETVKDSDIKCSKCGAQFEQVKEEKEPTPEKKPEVAVVVEKKKIKKPVIKKVKKVEEEVEEVEEKDEEVPSKPAAAIPMMAMLGNLSVVGGLVLVIVGLMFDVIKGDQFSMDTIGLMQWAIVGIGCVGLILGVVFILMGNKPAPVPAAKPSKKPALKKKIAKKKRIA